MATAAAVCFTLLWRDVGALAATKWQPAAPGYRFSFPRDYGAHERAQTEWWYYTGNVRDGRGHRYGFELTFFRSGVQRPLPHGSAWDINNLYLAHFALSDIAAERFFFSERTGRAALGLAGASVSGERVWIGSWQARRMASGLHSLRADMPEAAVSLRALPAKPLVIHGRDGVSAKGDCRTCASHYYSFTRLVVRGMLTSRGHRTPVSGVAWNDHEWGSDELQAGVVGWDWFSLQLNGERELMLYLLRRADGAAIPQSSGSLIGPDGNVVHLTRSMFSVRALGTWRSPHSGVRYPAGWAIVLPAYHARLRVVPMLADQELTTRRSTGVVYWEGACAIDGVFERKAARGAGYTELTGY
ncbi:MAG: carotenoid 1,2-hydratase [Candidatus Eremiobacteraeota bacterium]|nr:carotenoid 1,2-hydratase [Candidatus Eremiobacteraeota bacterium]